MPPSDSNPWFIQSLAGVTPADFVALRGRDAAFYSGLLHSAAAAEVERQAAIPNGLLSDDNSAEWSLLMLAPNAREQIDLGALDAPNFLDELDNAANTATSAAGQWPLPRCAETGLLLPFAAGWQLYLGYELAGQVEPVLAESLSANVNGVVAQARRVRGALLFNHRLNQAWCCLERQHESLFERIQHDLQAIDLESDFKTQTPAVRLAAVSEDTPERFEMAVDKTLQYIRDGDVFQVNLSRAWQLQCGAAVSSQALYQQLTRCNPAPFSAWLSVVNSADGNSNTGGFDLISSSPERLVSITFDDNSEDAWVNTRPIAGTRPRMPAKEQNQRYLDELRQSPKENAEHLMLIDLERNDLGRVCKPGSIEVNELMSIESFAHVHHIVSNVRGKKREGVSAGEVIAAVFPGGTITGCPKVRCMQIIAELEACERGAYTGAVGYLGLDGRMDLNIVIRSLVRSNNSPERLTLRAGAGIVADSNAQHELAETRAKANSVLRAFDRTLECPSEAKL